MSGGSIRCRKFIPLAISLASCSSNCAGILCVKEEAQNTAASATETEMGGTAGGVKESYLASPRRTALRRWARVLLLMSSITIDMWGYSTQTPISCTTW
jgi:PBP1b-binding outer membrane lipoprotein LpoB